METKDTATATETAPARKHKATYATDKRSGGYMVRVAGPNCDKFIGREVPVITKAQKEQHEKLIRLVWVGVDKESGEKVALYKFEPRAREAEVVEF